MDDTAEPSPLMQFELGVRAAWMDLREGTVDCALGVGIWRGLPHTSLFFRGYDALIALQPSERWRFVAAVRSVRVGESAEDPWRTVPPPSAS